MDAKVGPIECIVHGCTNKTDEGAFHPNGMCMPCYTMITTGVRNPSMAWFIQQIEDLEGEIYELQNYISINGRDE